MLAAFFSRLARLSAVRWRSYSSRKSLVFSTDGVDRRPPPRMPMLASAFPQLPKRSSMKSPPITSVRAGARPSAAWHRARYWDSSCHVSFWCSRTKATFCFERATNVRCVRTLRSAASLACAVRCGFMAAPPDSSGRPARSSAPQRAADFSRFRFSRSRNCGAH